MIDRPSRDPRTPPPDRLEHDLGRVLRDRGEGIEVPPPDLSGLLREGARARRTRRRRGASVVAGLAAASIVAGVVVVTVPDGPGGTRDAVPAAVPERSGPAPDSFADLPQGDAPGVAYGTADGLVLPDGTTVDYPRSRGDFSLAQGGGRIVAESVVGGTYLVEDDGTFDLLPAPPVRLAGRTIAAFSQDFTESSVPDVVVSPSGAYAAWVKSTDEPRGLETIVVDLDDRSIVDTVEFPGMDATEAIDPWQTVGFDARDRLFVRQGGEHWMWTPAGDVTAVAVPADDRAVATTADGLLTLQDAPTYGMTVPPPSRPVVAVEVADDGSITTSSVADTATAAYESEDGAYRIVADAPGTARAIRTDDGAQVDLGLPDDVIVGAVSWESERGVLMLVGSDGGSLGFGQPTVVRCDVVNGACEVALQSGDADLPQR